MIRSGTLAVAIILLVSFSAFTQNLTRQVALPDGGNLYTVTVTDADAVLCMSMKQIFRRESDDASWDSKIVFNGSSVNVKRMVSGAAGSIWGLPRGAGVWLSQDDGQTWQNMRNAPAYVTDLVQVDANTIYVTDHGQGFVVSTDGGASWEQRNGTMTNLYLQRLIRDAGGRLYTVTSSSTTGIFRSADVGQHWETLANGPTDVQELLLSSEGTLYAAGSKLWRSADNGDTWTEMTGAPGSIHRLYEAPDKTLFTLSFNTYFQLFRSTDSGANWDQLSGPTDAGIVRDICADSQGALYLTTTRGALRSTDNGDSWSHWSEGIQAIGVFDIAEPAAATLLLATQYSGLLLSTNSGADWHNVDEGENDTQYYAVASDGQGILYAGTRWGEIRRSSDDGNSWSVLNSGNNFSTLQDLIVTSTGTIMVGYQGGIAYTTDEGATWQTAPTGLPQSSCLRLMERSNGEILAGITKNGAYRSSDGGATWQALDPTFTSMSVSAFAEFGQVLAVGTLGAYVYISEDNGSTWTQSRTNLTSQYISDLVVSETGVLICSSLSGIFMHTEGADEWVRISPASINMRCMLLGSDDRLYFGTAEIGLYVTDRPLAASPPAVPILRTPPDDAVGTGTTPQFTWDANDDAMYYSIQIARDAAMQDLVWDFSFEHSTAIRMDENTLDTLSGYYWRLAAGNAGGRSAWSGTWHFNTGIPTGISPGISPSAVRMVGNFPEPFTGRTSLHIEADQTTPVVLRVCDLFGRTMIILKKGMLSPGVHLIPFDGSALASGTYLIVLETGKNLQVQRIHRLR